MAPISASASSAASHHRGKAGAASGPAYCELHTTAAHFDRSWFDPIERMCSWSSCTVSAITVDAANGTARDDLRGVVQGIGLEPSTRGGDRESPPRLDAHYPRASLFNEQLWLSSATSAISLL